MNEFYNIFILKFTVINITRKENEYDERNKHSRKVQI